MFLSFFFSPTLIRMLHEHSGHRDKGSKLMESDCDSKPINCYNITALVWIELY